MMILSAWRTKLVVSGEGKIGHESLDNTMAADVLAHYIAGE